MHAEGLCASELKHGPLAMVQDNFPTILFALKDRYQEHAFNAMNQLVVARLRAFVFTLKEMKLELARNFKCKENVPFHIALPKSTPCLQGILAVIPMQLLSFIPSASSRMQMWINHGIWPNPSLC
ncbi:hypothetical protein TCAL_13735, partial [Tigriopus californicus]